MLVARMYLTQTHMSIHIQMVPGAALWDLCTRVLPIAQCESATGEATVGAPTLHRLWDMQTHPLHERFRLTSRLGTRRSPE